MVAFRTRVETSGAAATRSLFFLSLMATLTFVIVGSSDAPIYEADLATPAAPDADGAPPPPPSPSQPPPAPPPPPARDADRAQYLHQFVLHAALDAVDDAAAASTGAHLGPVDRFNALTVSAYATPSRLRLLLLHDGRPDDVVRGFLRDVHEALVKASLNPFFSDCAPLTAPGFDKRVRSLARSYFRVV